MDSIKILVKLIYNNSNVPVIEQLNIDNDVTMESIEATINEMMKKGFMYMYIKMRKDAGEYIWIIDYLKSKTQNIEIDLSESIGIDKELLVGINRNLCYKIN